MALNTTIPPDGWLVDSAATDHFTNRRDWFSNFKTVHGREVATAQGYSPVAGIGDIELITNVGNRQTIIKLKDVYCTPQLRRNLMSIKRMDNKGYKIVIHNNRCKIFNPKGKLMAIAFVNSELYILDAQILNSHESEVNTVQSTNMETWHKRFCHASYDILKKMAGKGVVSGFEPNDLTHNRVISGEMDHEERWTNAIIYAIG